MPPTPGQRQRVLWLSTAAFTLLFAVWLMLGMLSIRVKPDLSLTDGQLYNLTIAAILAGSLGRFHFGVWTDRYGGRVVLTGLLLLTVVPTYLVSRVTSYTELLACAALFGLAGNAFAVGIAWNAAWWPPARQGLALGVFGAGNVGASVTKLFGPFLIAGRAAAGFFGLVPGGWRFIPCSTACSLSSCGGGVAAGPPAGPLPGEGQVAGRHGGPGPEGERVGVQPALRRRLRGVWWPVERAAQVLPGQLSAPELAVKLGLGEQLVGNFAAVNALKGDAYTAYMAANPAVKADLSYLIKWVGFLAAVCFVFPASLLRPLGGYLSDRLGAKPVMAAVFVAMLASGLVLSVPAGWGGRVHARPVRAGRRHGGGQGGGVQDDSGSFPGAVGAVGGLVGLLGALGGVLLPLSWGPLQARFGVPQVVFGALLALTVLSGGWFAAGWLATRQRKTVARPELATAAA